MKIIKRNNFSVYLIICSFLIVMGCSTNSNKDTATVNGSLSGETSQQKIQTNNVEGAVVTAARVTSEGSFETLEGTKTETDASGNFTLNVDAESYQHIVVVAEKEGQQWSGFLTSNVKNGSSYTLKPLNAESSAETTVFTELVASGSADLVSKADIETAIGSEAAAEIRSGSSAASRIAFGLKTAAQARAEYYADALQNDAETALKSTFEAMAEAQLRFESELESATSEEQQEAAFEMFAEAVVEAHTNAGLTISEAATSIEMWSRIAVKGTSSVSDEVKNNIRKNSSLIVAVAIDNAVQAEAQAAEMSETTKEAIVQAGVDLKAELRSSAGVAADVKAAFESYHDEVQAAIENDSKFEASVVVAVDSEINASSGFKSVFTSSLSGVLSANIVNEVYATFYSNIEGEVQSESSKEESEVELLARIMFLINLCN